MAVELPVCLQVDIGLQRPRRNDEAKLRPHADDAGLESAEVIAGAAVGRDLFVEIADGADLYLFGQELRRAPIQMPVDAVLVAGAGVDQVIGKAAHRREFVAGLRIKIRVASAEIERAVADAEIGEVAGIVLAHRDTPTP